MFKDFYKLIYQGGLEKKFISLCEDFDTKNNGEISKENLKNVLCQIAGEKFTQQAILKFVGQMH